MATRHDAIAAAGRPQAVPRRPPPLVLWAMIGFMALAGIASVLGRWLSGPNFRPTLPPPGPPSADVLFWVKLLQIASPLILVIFLWGYLIRPWLRHRRLQLDGMLLLSWLAIYFQDALMNYLTPQLLWSSYFVNFGSWTLGSFPTWISPKGNLLPEPLLAIGPTYGSLGFWPAIGACALMQALRRRYARMSAFELVIAGFIFAVIANALSESLLLRTGVYAYPGAIRALSLWPGTPYQFPLTSAIFFGAVMTATASLRFFRNGDNCTWVERGAERFSPSPVKQALARFLAVFGFVQLSMFVLFTVPIQWVGLQSDAWPILPAHLTNGLCAYGSSGRECPGPGVLSPRPPYN